jgi:hypothetical protein
MWAPTANGMAEEWNRAQPLNKRTAASAHEKQT